MIGVFLPVLVFWFYRTLQKIRSVPVKSSKSTYSSNICLRRYEIQTDTEYTTSASSTTSTKFVYLALLPIIMIAFKLSKIQTTPGLQLRVYNEIQAD